MRTRHEKQGVVLLLVLAILGLMSVLALTFVQMSQLERNISQNYLLRTRATLVAESGVEYALARIYNQRGGALTEDELDDMRYIPGSTPGLIHAQKASFQAADVLDRPLSGYTDTDGNADYFVLQVEDSSGKLNLNDSDGRWNLDTDPDFDDPATDFDLVNAPGRLRMLIAQLGDVLFGVPRGTDLANALMDKREALGGRFSELGQVKDALVPYTLDDDEWEQFAALVTLRSWQDPNTIRPTFQFRISQPEYYFPVSLEMNMDLEKIPVPNSTTPSDWQGFVGHLWHSPVDLSLPIPKGKNDDPDVVSYDSYNGIPDVEAWTGISMLDSAIDHQDASRDVYLFSDWQTRDFGLEPRSPVNVNTAAVELIEALIAPVQGWYLREGPGEIMSSPEYHRWLDGRNREWTTCLQYDPFTGDWADFIFGNSNFEYFWRDESALDIDGYYYAWPVPTGSRKDGRCGEAHRTPSLGAIQNVDLNDDGIPGGFAAELAETLFERIHGDGGDEGNPIETWEEFEAVLVEAVSAIPDNHETWDDQWWQEWIPGIQGYNPQIERVGVLWAGWPAATFNEPVADRKHWASVCRDVLVDCLLANFNPNSQLNDFNPDLHVHRMVDKAQLTAYTTEFCLEPTGVYKVSSLGVAVGPDDERLATQQINTEMKVFDLFRVTTQQQFLHGMELDGADIRDYSSKNPEDDTAWGTSLTFYPEPLLFDADDPTLPSGEYAASCFSDGSVGLATLEADARNATFHAAFDGRLEPRRFQSHDPIHSDGGVPRWDYHPTFIDDSSDIFLYPKVAPANCPTNGRLTQTGGEVPGCLLPDGGLSDAGRTLAYRGDNFGDPLVEGQDGAMEFWIKPNFDTRSANRLRSFVSMGGLCYNAARTELYGGGWGFRNKFSLTYFPHGHFTGISSAQPVYFRNEHASHEWPGFQPGGVGYSEGPTWIAPTSLVFEWYHTRNEINWPNYVGISTPTTSDDLLDRPEGQDLETTHPNFHVNSHSWSHIALRWNQTKVLVNGLFSYSDVNSAIGMVVNGKDPSALPTNQLACYDNLSTVGGATGSFVNPVSLYADLSGPLYVRLGEFARSSSCNWAADATYDEVVAYPYSAFLPNRALENEYAERGRYYYAYNKSTMAVYRSPAWDLFKELKLDRRRPVNLRSVSWTCYWPDNNEHIEYYNSTTGSVEQGAPEPGNADGDDVGFDAATPNDVHDDPLVDLLGWLKASDPLLVDVGKVDSLGAQTWHADRDGDADLYDDIENTLTRAAGSAIDDSRGRKPIQLNAGDKFQFRVYFNLIRSDNPADAQALFESPVLDDLTFTLASGKPEVYLWEIVNS